jgi:hypothetical protein
MTKILGIVFLLWSSVSFANVSGNWIGWGTWTYVGSGTHCDSMTLGFVETKDKLTRTGGYFDCQVVGLDIDAATFTKQGNNLIVDGVVVGNISENTIHLTEQYSPDVKIVSDIAIEAGHFDYSEIWYDKNDIVIYEITGRLFKKQ